MQEYISNNENLNIMYLEHEINKEKGAALLTGIRNASGDLLHYKVWFI